MHSSTGVMGYSRNISPLLASVHLEVENHSKDGVCVPPHHLYQITLLVLLTRVKLRGHRIFLMNYCNLYFMVWRKMYCFLEKIIMKLLSTKILLCLRKSWSHILLKERKVYYSSISVHMHYKGIPYQQSRAQQLAECSLVLPCGTVCHVQLYRSATEHSIS